MLADRILLDDSITQRARLAECGGGGGIVGGLLCLRQLLVYLRNIFTTVLKSIDALPS
jgi:hypothetical protein